VQPVERGKFLDLKTLEKRRQSITSHKLIRDGQEDEFADYTRLAGDSKISWSE